jgi:glutaminyl-tRNA synthetase
VEEGKDWKDYFNRNSLQVLTSCQVEPSLASAAVLSRWQFERKGYFCVDPDSKPGKLVFNGGARRSAMKGIRRKAPRRSAG